MYYSNITIKKKTYIKLNLNNWLFFKKHSQIFSHPLNKYFRSLNAYCNRIVIITFRMVFWSLWASLMAQTIKNLPAKQETWVPIPGSGRSSGEGNGNPLQYSCLQNSMDAWSATSSAHAQSRHQCMIATWSVHAQSRDLDLISQVISACTPTSHSLPLPKNEDGGWNEFKNNQ